MMTGGAGCNFVVLTRSIQTCRRDARQG